MEDLERNDGKEQPYFMDEKLRDLVHVKNIDTVTHKGKREDETELTH